MIKKALTGLAAATMVLGHTAAVAAPAERAAAPTSATEGAGVSNLVLILAFAALAVGIILVIEGNDNSVDDLPSSP